MKSFRASLFSLAVLASFALAVAVQPATAQLEQGKHIHHRLLPTGATCATCHKAIYDQWKGSPHEANGVECTVCHGETTAPDFAGTPGLGACEACHSDQVAQLKSDPFLKGKTCVNCHQAHVFTVHKKPATAAK